MTAFTVGDIVVHNLIVCNITEQEVPAGVAINRGEGVGVELNLKAESIEGVSNDLNDLANTGDLCGWNIEEPMGTRVLESPAAEKYPPA